MLTLNECHIEIPAQDIITGDQVSISWMIYLTWHVVLLYYWGLNADDAYTNRKLDDADKFISKRHNTPYDALRDSLIEIAAKRTSTLLIQTATNLTQPPSFYR